MTSDSYKCDCKPFYTGNGKECEPTMENLCEVKKNRCKANEKCEMVEGGTHKCVCQGRSFHFVKLEATAMGLTLLHEAYDSDKL